MENIYRFFMVIGLAHFGLALVLPITRWAGIFEGSDFEKLEREPLFAATCFLWILCLILLKELAELGYLTIGRRELFLIWMLTIVIAILVAYFVSPTSSLVLLSLTVVQFGKDTPTEKD